MAGSVAFLLDVLLLGVSYFLHLLRVELEEVRHAAQVGAGRRKAVCLVDERVEVRMCLHQVGRHRERVVEVGQRRVRMRSARVENGLRGRGDFLEERLKRHRFFVAFATGSFGGLEFWRFL